MSSQPEFVYVVVYTHRHGSDMFVYKTEEGVKQCKDALGEEYWEEKIGGERPIVDIGDQYFSIMRERDEEHFEVEQLVVNE